MAYFQNTSSSYSTYDPKKAAKKRKEKNKVPAWQKYTMGTVGNFFDDLGDFATGFFPGMFEIGKSAVNDARVATGLKSGSYKLDDVADAIWEDYKYTYGPAFSGDFKEFGKRVHEHPLGPVLDVLALVTAGGGAAGKIGKSAAKGGSIRGAEIAGLSVTPRALRAGESAASIKRAGGVVRHDGMVLDPKTLKFDTGTKMPLEVRAKNNPVKRGYQQAFGKLGENPYVQNVPAVGAAHRASRQARKLSNQQIDRQFLKTTGKASALIEKHAKDPAMQAAIRIKGSTLSPDEWIDAYKRQRNQLEDFDAFKGEGGEIQLAKAKKQLDDRIKLFQSDEVRNILREDSPELNSILDELRKIENVHTELLVDEAARVGNQFSPDFRRTLETSFVKGADEAASLRNKLKDPNFNRAEAPIIFPHVAESGQHLAALSGDFRKAAKSGSQRLNRGINMRMAADSLDPMMVVKAYRDTLQATTRIRNFEKLMDSARALGPMDSVDDLPGGAGRWERLSPGKAQQLREDAQAVIEFLDEDLKVMAGDHPEVAKAAQAVDDFLNKIGNTADTVYVPKSMAKNLLENFSHSKVFIVRMLKKGTDFWRYLTLGARPSWMMSNLVGQLTFLVATHGVFKSVKSYMQLRKYGRIADEFMPDVFSAGFVRSQGMKAGESFGKGDSLASRALAQFKRPVDTLQNLNAVLTDDIPRRAAFLAEIRPAVAEIRRANPGMGFEEAARKLLNEPGVVDEIAAKVIDDLVDFNDLTPAEKSIIRPVIPFYSWIKGATKRTARMTKDEPWKVAAGASIGQFGVESLQEQMGDLPDYLLGVMPVGEQKDGQQRVISAYSWNPFQTPGDVAGMAKNLAVEHRTGAENPMSSMNPFLKSAIEALTGEDIFYGTQLRDAENKSTARLYAERVRDSFPQVQAIKKSMHAGDERDYTPLFEPSAVDQLLAYMGMPLKTVNISTANQRAKEDDPRKI